MKELEKIMEQMDPESKKMMQEAMRKEQSGKLDIPITPWPMNDAAADTTASGST